MGNDVDLFRELHLPIINIQNPSQDGKPKPKSKIALISNVGLQVNKTKIYNIMV